MTTWPVPYQRAIALGKHGGDHKSVEFKDQVRNTNSKSSSDTAAYILARLDRDGHHKLAAQVRAGKLSANKAAQQAGFRKQRTPLETILRLLPKLTPAERQQLLTVLLGDEYREAAE